MIERSELTATQTNLFIQYTNDFHIFPSFSDAFATTITNNYHEEILATCNFLYNSWMQHSMFEQSTLPYFEEYLPKHGTRPKLMLYLPIKKRATPYQIQIEDLETLRQINSVYSCGVVLESPILVPSNGNVSLEAIPNGRC